MTDLGIMRELLEGQPELLADLSDWPPDRWVGLQSASFVVSSRAAARVLRGYLSGRIEPQLVSQWGTLVMSGIPPVTGPFPIALDIAYDPSNEDAVAQTVLRLESIGDLIDGSISAEKGAELLALLEAPSDERS